jgi:hypothetical protein
MLVRYPHVITITYAAKPTLVTSTGKYTPATPGTYSSICRAESNGKGSLVRNAEGNQYLYAYAVYLPVLAVSFPFGAAVTLANEDGTVFYTGKVQGFEQLQKSTKIWL